jgi:hypothetical protein
VTVRPIKGASSIARFIAVTACLLTTFAYFNLESSRVSAISVPDPPTVGGGIRIVSDNDYALFAGNATNVTRLIQQNNDVFWDQIAAAASYKISLEEGETYIYLMGMGGGGAEDIGGTLNDIDVTSISSGVNGLQRAVSRPGGSSESGYLLINPFLTGWDTASNGNCGGAITVCYGQYEAELSEVQTALNGAVWDNPPSVGWGQAGNAFAYPDSTAVMFRLKASTLGAGITTASGTSATVGWFAPSSDGGSAILDYTASAFRSSDNTSAGKSCTTSNGSARSCTISGLLGSTRYYFKVTARNSAGASASSDATGSILTSAAPPPTTTTTSTTTVPPATTTTAPARIIEIDIQAPAATLPVGQGSIATIAPGTQPVATAPQRSSTTTSSTVPSDVSATEASTKPTLSQAPVIPQLSAGEGAVDIAGKTVKQTLTRKDNQLQIQSGSLSATLSKTNANGVTAPLDNDGNLRLLSGDIMKINLGGFKPNSNVTIWFFSTPIKLGTAKVKPDGTVSAVVRVPNEIDDGPHRVAVVAELTNGKPATFTLGVVVGKFKTTSTLTRVLIVIPIVLAILLGVLLPNRLRRRRTVSA